MGENRRYRVNMGWLRSRSSKLSMTHVEPDRESSWKTDYESTLDTKASQCKSCGVPAIITFEFPQEMHKICRLLTLCRSPQISNPQVISHLHSPRMRYATET